MLNREGLVVKTASVDAHTTSAVVVCDVTTLAHELRDDTVEDRVLEVAVDTLDSLVTDTKRAEVFCGLWDDIIEKGELHATGGCSANGDVEEYLRASHCFRVCSL